MPKCINDSSVFYRGTEYSPLGRGYAASGEEVDTVKKGRDGKDWRVYQSERGTKRWVQVLKRVIDETTEVLMPPEKKPLMADQKDDSTDSDDQTTEDDSESSSEDEPRVYVNDSVLEAGQIVYLSWVPTEEEGVSEYGRIVEVMGQKDDGVYLIRGANYRNQGAGEIYDCPVGAWWRPLCDHQLEAYIPPLEPRFRPDPEPSFCVAPLVENVGVDPEKSYFTPNELKEQTRLYFTHDNGGRPFKVLADSRAVEVYVDAVKPIWDEKQIYNQVMVRLTNYQGIWFGYNSSSRRFDWGDRCSDGNSILIDCGSAKECYPEAAIVVGHCRYIHVGIEVYQFNPIEGDRIVEYYSPIGNNDVPYPVAIGEKYVYFMLDAMAIPREQLVTSQDLAGSDDLYREFYGHIHADRSKKGISFPNYNLIHKRVW